MAQVKPEKETELSFKVGGILEVVGPSGTEEWREGNTFRAGQMLARLKQSDFTNAVAQARAKADLDQRQFERMVKLLSEGVTSQRDYDAAQADHRASQATAAVAEQALNDSTLVAAQAGTILARFAGMGETVAAGRPVLKTGELRQMKVELGVPDSVVGRVKVGQEVRLTIPALNDRGWSGQVTEVGVAARPDTRLFKVVVNIPNADGVIKAGMTASVVMGDAPRSFPGAVVVPLSALITSSQSNHAGKLAVFVLSADRTAHERLVTTDDIIASSVIVTAGLTPGEQVVVAGASLLYEGALAESRPLP
jgi:RND family efflux transporter MFP subunit